ncbi:hypothetical protein PENTCL1PPCAC_16907, partial [Pristionchus entomophagus]
GTATSMFFISFEWQTASAQSRTYEKTSKSYGCKLALYHLIVVGVFIVGFLISYGYEEPGALCTITTPRGEIYTKSLATLTMFMEGWTITSFVKLLNSIRNMQNTGECYSLIERYQITENIRMLRVMLPVDTINNGWMWGIFLPFFFFKQYL